MAVDHLIDYIRDPKQTIDKHPELFDNQKQEEIKVKEGVQFQKTLKDKLGCTNHISLWLFSVDRKNGV
jgi:hypothetical protein